MIRNKVRYYLDVVIHHPDWTIEDFEEEEKKLKEESDKLTEWPPISWGWFETNFRKSVFILRWKEIDLLEGLYRQCYFEVESRRYFDKNIGRRKIISSCLIVQYISDPWSEEKNTNDESNDVMRLRNLQLKH
mgnify:CR=1 FL=1